MKTIEEVIEQWGLQETVKRPIIDDVKSAMSEYAREAVRELVTYGDDMKILKAWQHDDQIGTATDEDNLQKWMNTL
jgi:hypothetical protein